MTVVRLRHGKVDLALHLLRAAEGEPLLHLHGLGLHSPEQLPADLESWAGPVYALDFTGHGASTLPAGGGYTAEVLMADADVALAHLGPATVIGRGLGAYVALLIAGARPQLVRGAVLADGPGLAGGGSEPGTPALRVALPAPTVPDPFALAELSGDIRPPDYATSFVRQVMQLAGRSDPLTVCARQRPAWLAAVVAEPGVRTAASVEVALRGMGS